MGSARTRLSGARRGARSATGAAALGTLALVLAGCASLGGSSPAGGGSGPDGDGSEPVVLADEDGVLVQVRQGGGFVPRGWAFQQVAEITLDADGRAVVAGPTTLQYPGSLLPNLRNHQLDDEAVEEIVAAAQDAGLVVDAAPDYGMPMVTDAPGTSVRIGVDGAVLEHHAYALGLESDPDENLTDDQLDGRRALAGFVETVRARVEAAEETGPYVPEGFAVMAVSPTPARTDDVAPAEVPWPLAVALTSAPCLTLTGEDAAALEPVLAGARQGDRFTQDGVAHELWVRVLLPGDPGCTGDERAPAEG